ncbi:MAG: YciK family oxidoreductase [Pseudomonadota bacterium]
MGEWRWLPEPGALDGRTILVTGAGAGIGATLAKTYALYGANIVLLGKTRSRLEQVFDWIETHTNTQAVIVPCDLMELNEDVVASLADSISQTYGSLQGIVHNASLLGPKISVEHYPAQDWPQVFQVNVHAPFLLNKGLFELLNASEDACVIHVSSSVGRQGRAYWGAYSASKFALEGLSETFADECESAGRIRVYSLNPGGTRTAMRAKAYPAEDPMSVPPPEAHMDLFTFLMANTPGKTLPATGTKLDARDWSPDLGGQ